MVGIYFRLDFSSRINKSKSNHSFFLQKSLVISLFKVTFFNTEGTTAPEVSSREFFEDFIFILFTPCNILTSIQRTLNLLCKSSQRCAALWNPSQGPYIFAITGFLLFPIRRKVHAEATAEPVHIRMEARPDHTGRWEDLVRRSAATSAEPAPTTLHAALLFWARIRVSVVCFFKCSSF